MLQHRNSCSWDERVWRLTWGRDGMGEKRHVAGKLGQLEAE